VSGRKDVFETAACFFYAAVVCVVLACGRVVVAGGRGSVGGVYEEIVLRRWVE